MDRLATPVCEQPSRDVDPSGTLFGLLPRSPRLEDGDRRGVEIDAPAGPRCLATCLVQLVVNGDQNRG